MELLYVIFFAMVPILVFFFAIAFIAKVISKKSRIPFEYNDMARIPAFSLIQSQKDLNFNMVAWMMLATIYFQLPFSIPTISQFLGFDIKITHWWVYACLFFAAALYHLLKAIKEFSKLRNVRLGIEAEWAVSYALSKITDRNVRVFHDIQGPNFNIDHVVTYPGGVLAIETKGRRKPNIKGAKDSHRLIVEGDTIQFPNFTDRSIIEQAKRQAQWLSKELTQSTGMEVVTQPLVVIPGWYIEIKQKPAVPVMNHKSLTKYYSISKRPILDNSALDRINHQIEQLAMRRTDEF
ncbi:NERD domain-containing protein [Aestuariibacter sp. GS-14]|uniref:nuclease-related domain-containing protein n=1 Tax=Aestuariibacter sp. GS-14 TaxID=2590670 RepID=UPI00112CA561|nr:nuclease-related domain-containing protein [Aestuariibacter sp. GS-14]TPV54786.1 NERD domain-containing protein [Aestuariibacter sp. GS-14]